MANRSVSAATVTVNEAGDILLIRRADSGEWQIPGGILEDGESPPEAAVRETWEEARVLVKVDRCTGVYTHIHRNITAFVFLAHVVSDESRPTDESVAVKWFNVDEAVALCAPVFKTRIEDAISQSNDLAFRKHDGIEVIDQGIVL